MGTKRIIGLNATTDFESDDYIAVDGSTAGTRKMAQSVLKEKLRDSTLSDIHNLPTTITAFRTGDVIPVDGQSGTAKMSKDSLLQTTTNEAKKINDFDRLYSITNALRLTDSVKGYVASSGNINTEANETFRYFVCKVEVGTPYVVRTRLGTSTTFIAGGDSADQTTGLTKYKNQYTDPNVLRDYEITPTKEYLFISFRKVENVAPYTSDDWEAYATTEAPAVDTTGIVPSNFVSDGFTPVESENVLSGTGVFVAWGHTQASRQVSRIKFYANQSGFIRFGVGIIDQRKWAIVDQYADVPCSAGLNDINVLGYGLVIPRNGYLFTKGGGKDATL